MTDRELALIARGMVPVLREAVEVATSPLLARIAALEQRASVPGRDGRDGSVGPVGPMGEKGMAGDIGPTGPAGPQGPAGERGERGEAGPIGEVGPTGPTGAMGESGQPGPVGEKGADGRDGKDVDMDLVMASIASEVQKQFDARTAAIVDAVTVKAVAAIPVPKDGKDGRDGADGKDGADGLGFDDIDVAYDSERSFEVRFVRGDVVKAFPRHVPAMIYRDVFVQGQSYQAGDVVTWAGGMWVAKADTDEKPGTGATAWKLCVKAGRDGKGIAGPQGPPGPRGEKGERW